MYKIIFTENFGRGLYATRDIKQGETITQCELLVLSPEDTKKVNDTDLKYYTFFYNSAQDCLVLGEGEIFNHDDQNNVDYKLIDFDGRKLMRFTAKIDISQGEQLFIDYNQDININTQNYLKNKSLI